VLPLALWYTVGQGLRYGLGYWGYKLGQSKGAVGTIAPLVTLSLLILITLAVTVAMVHCVREGLNVVHARETGGDLTPWAVGNDESMIEALNRAVVPFVIFYLAWGMIREDALEFADDAQARGFAEGGFEGGTKGLGLISALDKHATLAIGLTAGFFVLRLLADWLLAQRLRRAAGLIRALLEVNFALFAIFTIDHARGIAGDWLIQREAWRWFTDFAGGALDLWPAFKYAVLGGLIWLVIAGVILGLDASDERVVLGRGKAGRRVARVSGVEADGGLVEFLTRGLRETWLPAWYGLRLVRRSGIVPFGVFAMLFAGLDVVEVLARRQIYELLGPHEAAWWTPVLPLIGFGTGLVFQILRICLLAATFNLVMARVTGRTAAKAVAPAAPDRFAEPPATPSSPWSGAARP
jgi:hypothetical protein